MFSPFKITFWSKKPKTKVKRNLIYSLAFLWDQNDLFLSSNKAAEWELRGPVFAHLAAILPAPLTHCQKLLALSTGRQFARKTHPIRDAYDFLVSKPNSECATSALFLIQSRFLLYRSKFKNSRAWLFHPTDRVGLPRLCEIQTSQANVWRLIFSEFLLRISLNLDLFQNGTAQ